VKAAAMVKYAAMMQLIVSLNLAVNVDQHNFVSTAFFRSWSGRFVKGLPYPCTLAATLGGTVCISSMIREKDDVINVWIAVATTSIVAALKTGLVTSGVRWGTALGFLGTFWQLGRSHEHGFTGFQAHKGSGTPTPPLLYQTTGFEHIKPFDNTNQKYFGQDK